MNNLSVEDQLKAKIQIIINYLDASNYEEVVKRAVPLIKKFPGVYILNNVLGLAYNAIGKYELALKTLDDAIKIDTQNIFVLNNLGLVNGNLGNIEKAEKYLKRALLINPSFLDAAITLANLKIKIDQNEEAVIILENMKKLYKRSFTLNFSLGNIYQQIGNFSMALECFQLCLQIDPTKTASDKAISLMTKYDLDNNHLKEMKNKFGSIKSDENKMFLSFSLGKALEDCEDYKGAFKHLEIANGIKNKAISYSIEGDKKLFQNIKYLFDVKNLPTLKPSKKKILFILGMPRSGTTLVEQILSSHTNVYGAGELKHVQDFAERKFLKDSSTFHQNKIDRGNLDEFVSLKEYYLEKINSDKEIVTDKAPLNFKWIGFLLIAFPNCKIIHLNRNPMDICWSLYKNYFPSDTLNFCYDLKNLGNYYLIYKDLMFFWNTLFKDKIYNIEYENLIKNQKQEIKGLLHYCNLDWDENCMTFYKNKNSVFTASLAQVRSPIYKSSVKLWKNYSDELNDLLNIIKS